MAQIEQWIAVIDWDAEGRVTKLMEFDNPEEATGFSDRAKEKYPNAFAARRPEGMEADFIVKSGALGSETNVEATRIRLLEAVRNHAENLISAGFSYNGSV